MTMKNNMVGQRYTRHMHRLAFRQIHTSTTYYQQSFYLATVHTITKKHNIPEST